MPCEKFGWRFPIDALLRLEVYHKKFGMPINRDEVLNYKDMIEKCDACGECEKNCPYNVPIVSNIKRLYEALS